MGHTFSKLCASKNYYTSITDYGRLQVHEHSPGNVLARPGLAEKGIEGVVPATNGLVRRHLAVWLDTVLQTVELPAGIADLHSGLTNVDRDALTLRYGGKYNENTILHIIIILDYHFGSRQYCRKAKVERTRRDEATALSRVQY